MLVCLEPYACLLGCHIGRDLQMRPQITEPTHALGTTPHVKVRPPVVCGVAGCRRFPLASLPPVAAACLGRAGNLTGAHHLDVPRTVRRACKNRRAVLLAPRWRSAPVLSVISSGRLSAYQKDGQL